jgi:hypothetical protein
MAPLPPTDPTTWPDLHARPLSSWAPALAALARTWRLGGAWERLPGGEDSVVFASGGTAVKLVPPHLAADAARDVSVMPRLDLPVPSPRLEDVRHEDGWTLVRMTRLAGRPAADAWPRVPRVDRLRIVGVVGAVLRAFWRTPVCADDGDPVALLERLLARLPRHAEEGFADPAGFAARHLPQPLPTPALLHFDLNDGNVLLEERGGRWEVSGVLDFVASRAFHPPLDLVTPAVFFCRGDPALLRALLEGAALGDLPAEELAAWHLLHPFAELRRDLALAGRTSAASAEAALGSLWRRG